MNRAPIALVLVAAALGLAVTGCGGASGEVPSGVVAVVDGTEIPQSDLDALIAQAKASSEESFPRVGTPEYQSVQQQYVAFLVQKTEFEQAAEELKVKITEKDVQKMRDDFVKDRFGGDEKKFFEALKEQGMTEEELLKTLRVGVLSQKIFNVVTKDVTVTDAEALTAFTQNQAAYGGTPDSRQVRHILIAEQDANGQVDFAKSKAEAERIYKQLQDGADFEALVQKYSADTGTKVAGGKYLAKRGQSVPEFDQAAFALKTNEISHPIRTQYGYHVIQALTDIKPGTSFEKLKDVIKTSLLQEKRNAKMMEWVQDLQKRYEGKVTYATGFAPPEIPEQTDETQTQ
jgi:parvulin-like peptidyl-prolyl isomerase